MSLLQVDSLAFWPQTALTLADFVTKIGILVAGAWAFYQFYVNSRTRAVEAVLKIEEEFREVSKTFLEFEYLVLYDARIRPVLKAANEKNSPIDQSYDKKLWQIDRALRFLFMCCELSQTIVLGRDVVEKSYYYYIGLLRTKKLTEMPELEEYVCFNFPRLRDWIDKNEEKLQEFKPTTNCEDKILARKKAKDAPAPSN